MGQRFFLIILFVGCMTPSGAQIHQDKYETVVKPMDQAVERSRNEFGDVPKPGEEEGLLSSKRRYENNVAPMDAVVEKHFTAPIQDEAFSDKKEPGL